MNHNKICVIRTFSDYVLSDTSRVLCTIGSHGTGCTYRGYSHVYKCNRLSRQSSQRFREDIFLNTIPIICDFVLHQI